MKKTCLTLLGGMLGGFLYQSCVPPVDAANGWSITESARRIADAVERMADQMEKKK